MNSSTLRRLIGRALVERASLVAADLLNEKYTCQAIITGLQIRLTLAMMALEPEKQQGYVSELERLVQLGREIKVDFQYKDGVLVQSRRRCLIRNKGQFYA